MRQARSPLRSAFWTYFLVIGIAILAGFVLDRYGPKPALAFVLSLPLILAGIQHFASVCAVSIFVLPLVPTVLLSKQASGIPGIHLSGALLVFAAVSIFLSCALRPRQIRMPHLPLVFVLYLAVLAWGAVNGARFISETPDYLQVLGLVYDKTPGSYLKAWLVAPLLVLGTAAAAGVLTANAASVRWVVVPALCSAVIFSSIVYFFAWKGASTLSEMAGQDGRRLLSGTGQHANEISLTLNMALALALSVFTAVTGHVRRLLLGCCALLLVGGVYLTFSRGGYIGTAVVLVYFLLTHRGHLRVKLISLALLASVLFAVPDSMVKRTVETDSTQSLHNASSGRVDDIWRPLIPSIMQSPLIGKGHGSILWSDAAKERRILPVGHPHNAYLAALLDVGLIGTIVILIFLAHMWHTFWRLGASGRPGLATAFYYGASACIPILLVQGVTDDAFVPRYTHSYMWIAYGAALGSLARGLAARRAGHYRASSRATSTDWDQT